MGVPSNLRKLLLGLLQLQLNTPRRSTRRRHNGAQIARAGTLVIGLLQGGLHALQFQLRRQRGAAVHQGAGRQTLLQLA